MKSQDPNFKSQEEYIGMLRVQSCPLCDAPMGDMPGMRDAVCHNCGFKDPCCE
jgi:hypothetical protein